jgi:hypothetical protein
MGAARDEMNLGAAAFRQAGAEIAADPARAHDRNPQSCPPLG